MGQGVSAVCYHVGEAGNPSRAVSTRRLRHANASRWIAVEADRGCARTGVRRDQGTLVRVRTPYRYPGATGMCHEPGPVRVRLLQGSSVPVSHTCQLDAGLAACKWTNSAGCVAVYGVR